MSRGMKMLSITILGFVIILGMLKLSNGGTEENVQNNNGYGNLFNSYIEENNVEENVVEVEETENEVENTVIEEKSGNEVKENIIGKEEEESAKESLSKEEKEKKAIEMAKKEWGISINSYLFEIKSVNSGVYEISVRNKTDRNEVAIYLVDVNNDTIKEK